jgi:hypothetical protein
MRQQFCLAKRGGTLMGQPVGPLADQLAIREHEISPWVLSDSVVLKDPRDINCNAVLGIGIATVLSLGLWAGIGLGIAYLLK